MKKGVMVFAPAGVAGWTVENHPLLLFEEEIWRKGLTLLEELAVGKVHPLTPYAGRGCGDHVQSQAIET